jgi:Ig-like domain from next to BRCA1 gene
MEKRRRNRLLAFTFMVLLPALACNMPRGGNQTPTSSQADLIYTAAAETVQAQLTQVALPPATSTGGTPGFPTTIPTFPVPTSITPVVQTPAVTRVPPSPTSIPCDRIKFVKDVTYPDNTEVAPGTSFIKTWRLQNDGSCTWTTAYTLVFAGGDSMGAPASTPLTGNVAPGQTVDLSVTLTAPTDGGTYRGDYKLRNASNVVFGLGNANNPFFVQIKVPVATGLLFDFISQASKAAWVSSVGNAPGTTLAFNGADDDPNGTAKIKDSVKLENGTTTGKVLLTFPKHENDGNVSGLYPAYAVQSGDHLKGNIGFMLNSGDVCGAGNATFQVVYLEGSTTNLLQEWQQKCDGKLTNIDIDLSGLKGKTVQFGLVVKANGDFTDDWAVWNSLRIVH